MKHVSLILSLTLLLTAAGALPGCRKELPEGTPQDWLQDARDMEAQGLYFQEARENAPLGALEYYRLCLERGEFGAETAADIRHRIAWLSAVRLVLEPGYLGRPDYPEAIVAMTQFRQQWPDSPYRGLALFYRGLAKEYDIDAQDTAGAIADYQQFIRENPGHSLVPEARLRIGHCWEFDLDHSDYRKAMAAYDALIAEFGPSNDALRNAPTLQRMAVERALYHKALILENRLAESADPAEAEPYYAAAAECYRRLTDPLFFGKVRFKRSQFVHFRLGVLLAEKLQRVDEGLAVLQDMANRWSQSPWKGRVGWKMEQIRKAAAAPRS